MLEMLATGLVELYIGKDFQWKGAFTSSNLANIAQRFKIYYAGTNTAPYAKVILGPSGKKCYDHATHRPAKSTKWMNHHLELFLYHTTMLSIAPEICVF